jgi:hypothetical protein
MKALEVGVTVSGGGDTVEDDMFLCICEVLGWVGGIVWGYMFA